MICRSMGTKRAVGIALSAFLLTLLSPACGDGDEAGSTLDQIPGLNPDEEVELVEVDPDPSDGLVVWIRAYQVEGLPPVNVGHPTQEFLDDAHRVDEDPEQYQCMGDASGSGGCSVEDAAQPSISGLTFGGPDIRAWSWEFVPEDAVAVRFTDQDGETSWQRPQDGLVIFPDTVADDPDGNCPCRLDAIEADGAVIVSVDLETTSYVTD
jgi:hypothetical protein